MNRLIANIQLFFFIWLVVLFLNQFILFGACFKAYCLMAALPHTGVISFILSYVIIKDKENSDTSKVDNSLDELLRNFHEQENIKKKKEKTYNSHKDYNRFEKRTRYEDKYTQMGNNYEKYIGQQFEKKGDLVIYNGLIFGFEDEGVDIVSISSNEKYINLIQCKNWYKKQMSLEELEQVYLKIKKYELEFSTFHFKAEEINKYLLQKRPIFKIDSILENCNDFIFRKTLYIASDKVMDLDIGRELNLIKSNIFQYKDMKIVFKEIEK